MVKVNEIGDKWDELAMQTERKLCVLKDVRTLHQFNCICQDMVSETHPNSCSDILVHTYQIKGYHGK